MQREGSEEGKWFGIGLRECYNVCQVFELELEVSNFLSMRVKQCDCPNVKIAIVDDV